MFQLSKSFINRPLLSLRTGSPIGIAVRPIINPSNLKIEGWYVEEHHNKDPMILLAKDLRDIIVRGLIVDDSDVLARPNELLRLQDVLKIDFQPIGKAVISNHRRHIGKVGDYAVEMDSLFIQKLYVEQSLFRSLSDGQLSIDRSQIVEISPKRIVVTEPDEKVSAPAAMPAGA